MGWLDWVRLAAPIRSARDEPASPIRKTGNVVIISYTEAISAEKALSHPVIARCIRKLSESVQSVRWFAEEDSNASAAERSGKARIIADLNSLLQAPTDGMTGADLRFWMAMNYALYSRFAVKIGVASSSGTANGIYPLTTRFVKAVTNQRGLLNNYEYGEGENKEILPIRRKAAKNEAYAYQVAMPNLDGTFVGRSGTLNQLCSIGLPSQVIRLLLQRAIDTAGGHPNTKYVITTEKTLTKAQKEALIEHINETAPGDEESGNILLLQNTSVKVEKLDNDLSDIHSKMPMDDMSRMIAGAFGIPIALLGLGAADGARFASNYTESRRAFWADTIVPGYLTPISNGLTQAICPPGVRISFDLDSIDALRDHNVQNSGTLERVTFLSIDEKRELVGFDPLDTDESKAVPSPSTGNPPPDRRPPQSDDEEINNG